MNTFTRPRVTCGRLGKGLLKGERCTTSALCRADGLRPEDGTLEIRANMVISAVVERHLRGVAAPSVYAVARKPDQLPSRWKER
jgi:hypothetical protein